MSYERGKVYKLSFPCDGMNIETRQTARYPIGLPVKFIVERDISPSEKYYIVVEPHGGVIAFPLTPIWNQNPLELFDPETSVQTISTLEEYPSEEEADAQWELYTNPELNRWHFEIIRANNPPTGYADWECGYSEIAIQHMLEVGKIMLGGYSQDMINAILDISLLLYGGDNPEWVTEEDKRFRESMAYKVVECVESMLTLAYTVKTGKNWNLEEGKLE